MKSRLWLTWSQGVLGCNERRGGLSDTIILEIATSLENSIRGVKQAMALGFVMVQFTFKQVTSCMCESANHFFEVMEEKKTVKGVQEGGENQLLGANEPHGSD